MTKHRRTRPPHWIASIRTTLVVIALIIAAMCLLLWNMLDATTYDGRILLAFVCLAAGALVLIFDRVAEP